ncbi:unnamed protein product [Sphenostylis stenocarpa]|uniref:Uncharacterized protein n=1 Tax=Sphenostylis stenocarpa TaxID=92480 RepID=A0AA86V492_9FABA|nr:unnamed protein product [Sphenostylis stenocarpa]
MQLDDTIVKTIETSTSQELKEAREFILRIRRRNLAYVFKRVDKGEGFRLARCFLGVGFPLKWVRERRVGSSAGIRVVAVKKAGMTVSSNGLERLFEVVVRRGDSKYSLIRIVGEREEKDRTTSKDFSNFLFETGQAMVLRLPGGYPFLSMLCCYTDAFVYFLSLAYVLLMNE